MKLNETKNEILARIQAEAKVLGKAFEDHTADVVAKLHTDARNAIVEAAIMGGLLGVILGLFIGSLL